MSRFENIKKSYEQAVMKRKAIEANTQALLKKRENIDKQLKANQDKIKKLDFFLEKTSKTLQDQKS